MLRQFEIHAELMQLCQATVRDACVRAKTLTKTYNIRVGKKLRAIAQSKALGFEAANKRRGIRLWHRQLA